MVIHKLARGNSRSRQRDDPVRQMLIFKLGKIKDYPPFAHRLSDHFPTPLHSPVHTLIDRLIHKRMNAK
jgi:hypothetical protein